MTRSHSRLAHGMLFAAVLLAGCSTGEFLTGAAKAGKGAAGSVGSFYSGMSGTPEEDATNIAGYSTQFKTQYGRWPASLRELTDFVKGKGEQLWPRRLDNLKFKPKEDGRLVIFGEYIEPGFDDSNKSYGGPTHDTAVILITPDGKLRLEIAPTNLKQYE